MDSIQPPAQPARPAASPEKPIIATFVDSDLLTRLSERLHDRYQIESYIGLTQADQLVARLADAQAALMLVQAGYGQAGEDERWTAPISSAKTSPATRRIPVIAIITDDHITDDQQMHQAMLAGADHWVTVEQLLAQPETLITQYMRRISPEDRQRIAQSCADPLPETARQAIELFNAGEYYQQHDLLEALWMETAGPIRDLYRAILQVGIAYYQITRGNERGALKMLLRSQQWLAALPDQCQGVNVAQLRTDAAEVRRVLESRQNQAEAPLDLTLLRPVMLFPR